MASLENSNHAFGNLCRNFDMQRGRIASDHARGFVEMRLDIHPTFRPSTQDCFARSRVERAHDLRERFRTNELSQRFAMPHDETAASAPSSIRDRDAVMTRPLIATRHRT